MLCYTHKTFKEKSCNNDSPPLAVRRDYMGNYASGQMFRTHKSFPIRDNLHYIETESSCNFISQRIHSHTTLRNHKSPLTSSDHPRSHPEWYSTQREGPPHFFPGNPPKLLSWCSASTAGVLWYQPWSQITTEAGGRNRRKESERVPDMYTESFLNHFIQFRKCSLQLLHNRLPDRALLKWKLFIFLHLCIQTNFAGGGRGGNSLWGF